MSKRILGLDDSAVLRKALEWTFESDDLVLSTYGALGAALASPEEPALLLVDTVLGGDDGYAAGKALKERFPNAALLFLTSRHAPFDAAKAHDASGDGNLDKPFDSQVLLDKAHQLIAARGAVAPASAMPVRPPSLAAFRAPAAPIQPSGPRQIQMPQSFTAPQSSVRVPGSRPGVDGLPSGVPAQPPRLNPTASQGPASSVAAPSVPTAAVYAGSPEISDGAGSTIPPRTSLPGTAGTSATPAFSDAEVASKLAPLNLSESQQTAVLALTRELVERVVWEVVPGMAEALIREELARLTR